MVSNPDEFFNLFDILWVGLACYTAWNMLEASKFVSQSATPVTTDSDARVD